MNQDKIKDFVEMMKDKVAYTKELTKDMRLSEAARKVAAASWTELRCLQESPQYQALVEDSNDDGWIEHTTGKQPVSPTDASKDRYHYGYRDGLEFGRNEAEMTHTGVITPTNDSPVEHSANNAQRRSTPSFATYTRPNPHEIGCLAWNIWEQGRAQEAFTELLKEDTQEEPEKQCDCAYKGPGDLHSGSCPAFPGKITAEKKKQTKLTLQEFSNLRHRNCDLLSPYEVLHEVSAYNEYLEGLDG